MVTSPTRFPLPTYERTKPDRVRTFVDEHYDRLWRILRRLGVPDAGVEDAAQEVFLTLARRIDDVLDGAEWGFVYAVARRIASDVRRKERARFAEETDAVLLRVADPREGRALAAADERQLLDFLLGQLPEEQREVVVLVELEQMTMAETAALLQIPAGTVASRLRRARAHMESAAAALRSKLQEQGWST